MITHTTHNAPAAPELKHIGHSPSHNRPSDGTGAIVLHDGADAKAKLANARVADEVVAAIMALERKRPALMSALVDCVCTDDTAKAIARRYSIHPSVLSYWTTGVGLPKRERGRPALLEPTLEHERILELVRKHGVAETARRVGVSKQRIHHVVCRWEPRLKGRRSRLKAQATPKREPRVLRNIVVSFRISTAEWHRLLATHPTADEKRSSGFGKARAIVLNYLGPSRVSSKRNRL
jgi:hypothetical protein